MTHTPRHLFTVHIVLLLVCSLTFSACRSNPKPTIYAIPHGATGMASWYGPGFHGRFTASGERFDMNRVSAAHKTLPFGTVVRVVNLNNNRTLEVRINDRGPFVKNRVIDLSKEAARQLDMIRAGVVPVRLEVLQYGPS